MGRRHRIDGEVDRGRPFLSPFDRAEIFGPSRNRSGFRGIWLIREAACAGPARGWHLRAEIPRVQCPTHRVKAGARPWAEPRSRFTLLMERLRLVFATSVEIRAARRQGRVSAPSVQRCLFTRRRPVSPASTRRLPLPTTWPRVPAPQRHRLCRRSTDSGSASTCP